MDSSMGEGHTIASHHHHHQQQQHGHHDVSANSILSATPEMDDQSPLRTTMAMGKSLLKDAVGPSAGHAASRTTASVGPVSSAKPKVYVEGDKQETGGEESPPIKRPRFSSIGSANLSTVLPSFGSASKASSKFDLSLMPKPFQSGENALLLTELFSHFSVDDVALSVEQLRDRMPSATEDKIQLMLDTLVSRKLLRPCYVAGQMYWRRII
jgi:hypothetical protein